MASIKEIYIKNAQGQLQGPYSLEIGADGVQFDDGNTSLPLTAVLGTLDALRSTGVSEEKSLANIIFQLLQKQSSDSLDSVIIGNTELTENQLKKLLTLL